MKSAVMLELLEAAAEQLAIKVSYEPLQVGIQNAAMRGGLCKVKAPNGMQWRVIIDKRATDDERVQTLATALAGFDTSELELPEKARELLRMYARPAGRAA